LPFTTGEGKRLFIKGEHVIATSRGGKGQKPEGTMSFWQSRVVNKPDGARGAKCVSIQKQKNVQQGRASQWDEKVNEMNIITNRTKWKAGLCDMGQRVLKIPGKRRGVVPGDVRCKNRKMDKVVKWRKRNGGEIVVKKEKGGVSTISLRFWHKGYHRGTGWTCREPGA